MNLTRCKKGHFYDADRFSNCPHCNQIPCSTILVGNPPSLKSVLEKYLHEKTNNSISIPKEYLRFGKPQLVDTDSTASVYKLVPDKKDYAVKVIDCGNDEEKKRAAEYEIKIMQRLSNVKGTIPLIDWKKEENNGNTVYYLLMEYYEPMTDRLQDRNIEEGEIIRIGKEICTIIAEMRKNGVLHLDIQPKNVFFDQRDTCYLGNFGSALLVEDLQKDNKLRGTKAYMAPEVYSRHEYSERSEIYSLGILLYTLSNGGRLPLTENYAEEEAITRRLQGEPFIAHTANTALSFCLREACCANDPEYRYKAFDDFNIEWQEKQNCFVGYGEVISIPVSDWQERQDGFAFYDLGEPVTPSIHVSEVQFSTLFPKRFMKGEYSILEMYLYEEEYRKVVDEAIRFAEVGIKESRSGFLEIKERAKVRVLLECADKSVQIDGNNDVQTWNKKYLKFDFAVYLEENYPKRQVMFTATVYFDDVPATRLRFVAECNTMLQQKMDVVREDILSAFVSYASEDRSRVATIIQGMKKARPEMDIFFDVDKLRSGVDWEKAIRAEIERRDLLFLCWSQHAKDSVWVDREWRYALQNKGLESIEPVPIDPPDQCPPPEELASKSFNDRELVYLR